MEKGCAASCCSTLGNSFLAVQLAVTGGLQPPLHAALPAENGTEAAAGQHEGQQDASRTLQEWVEALVTQMGEAQGLDDARGRAAHVLQAFQQAILQAQSKVSFALQASDRHLHSEVISLFTVVPR